MQNVVFTAHDHKYRVDGKEYISATTLIDLYRQEFDSEFWSMYKGIEQWFRDEFGDSKGNERFVEVRRARSFKSPGWFDWVASLYSVDPSIFEKYQQAKLTEWRLENEESKRKGSEYHDLKEKEAYEIGHAINPFTKEKHLTAQKKGKHKKTIKKLRYGYYPELILWNDEFSVIGTADRVFIGGRWSDQVWIDDYKTNKEIKKANMYQKMKTPLGKLDDCNYNHYRLQIGLYAWMLEQHGYKIKGISINHLGNHMKMQYHSIKPYVENMLMHYKNGGDNKYGFYDWNMDI